jgi:hypothetical protein
VITEKLPRAKPFCWGRTSPERDRRRQEQPASVRQLRGEGALEETPGFTPQLPGAKTMETAVKRRVRPHKNAIERAVPVENAKGV